MNEEKLLQHLQNLEARFEEVALLITDPSVIADDKRFVRLSKEYRRLEELHHAHEEYNRLKLNRQEAMELLNGTDDEEMKALAKEEIAFADEQCPQLQEKIALLLLPDDPEDGKNAIMEIRAGTGGDEAALFARDLFKMYTRFVEGLGWRVEVSSYTEGTLGGYKEIVFSVTGDNAYGTLKYESGVHRVQRVPETEAQGRIHTSAATVAVFPEADEFDVEIKESDLRIDTFCSSGAGGQSVNTTYSAVRIVHVPTGITVQSQDERSQLKNKAKALTELRSRIYNLEHQKYLDEVASRRKTMVSTGDRSAKIRTYNYPQGRLTDHRIGLTLYNLQAVLDGDLKPIIDALSVAENSERLQEAALS